MSNKNRYGYFLTNNLSWLILVFGYILLIIYIKWLSYVFNMLVPYTSFKEGMSPSILSLCVSVRCSCWNYCKSSHWLSFYLFQRHTRNKINTPVWIRTVRMVLVAKNEKNWPITQTVLFYMIILPVPYRSIVFDCSNFFKFQFTVQCTGTV